MKSPEWLMGNDQSVGMEGALPLQSQGAEHLWSLELNRGKGGEGEGVCVFCRTFGNKTQDDLCKAGLEHLRLLRHPNIVKFLGTQQSSDQFMIVTEPVIPVVRVLEGMSMEGLVMGWRGISCALDFLHGKAKISHNNLSEECVHVSTVDSQWKLGGFETARHFKKIDASFLSDISSIRHDKAIPPEDKGKNKPSDVPCHSRDIWAFGQLMLILLEDTALEGHVEDSLFNYIRDKMLHSDPHLRPIASEVMNQQFMRNISSELCDFLSKLTLKNRKEKDQFFLDLPRQLHSLPQAVIAEHVVPLLINPLVMAEPLARDSLWKHLLLPVSSLKPRPCVFDPTHPCPLLEKDLFHAHILPLLLNLLESRELHVRMTLLAHLPSFACVIPQQELVNTVLPEVLVGLNDTRGEMVSATLHTLAELVPLLGPEAVIGTTRRQVFVDSQPRMNSLPIVTGTSRGASTQSHVTKAPPKIKTTPPLAPKNSREERKERMREKREQQRLKKMAQNKLGKVADKSVQPLLGGEESVETSDGENPVNMEPSSDSAPQYSPSVSHDEKEEEEEQWAGLEESEKEEGEEQWEGLESAIIRKEARKGVDGRNIKKSVIPIAASVHSNEINKRGSETEGDSEEDWGGFDEGEGGSTLGLEAGGWGSAWTTESDFRTSSVTSSQSQGDLQQNTPLATPTTPTGSGKGKLKLSLKSTQSTSEDHTAMATSPVAGGGKRETVVTSPRNTLSSSSRSATSELGEKMKGRLKKEDIERLEHQALLAAAEPDFFADMAPKIGGGGSSSSSLMTSPRSETKKTEPVKVASAGSASALQYQPTYTDQGDSVGWGEDEDWNDF